MNKRKFPASVFISWTLGMIFVTFRWLFIPAVILLLLGIRYTFCLYIGCALLLADIILSLIQEMKIRRTFLEDSDDPDFRAFQDAVSKDGNWRKNVLDYVNERIGEQLYSEDDTSE